MEKKKLLKSKWLLPLVFVAILTAAIAIYVIAKYAGGADVDGEVKLQGFDVTPVVTTTDATWNSGTDWDSDTGIVEMTAAQYAGFKLDIDKTGNGWAYIRVSVEESWRIRTTVTGTEVGAITAGGSLNWDGDLLTNNSSTIDNFHYVDGIVTGPTTISIIDASTTSATSNTAPSDIVYDNTSEELVVRLSIKVEAIQYNRLNTFWGLSGDPL